MNLPENKIDLIDQELISKLAEARKAVCFPPTVRRLSRAVARTSLGLLFPHFAETLDCDSVAIEEEVLRLKKRIIEFQNSILETYPDPDLTLSSDFIHKLPGVHDQLMLDAQAIVDGDPAAQSLDEVIISYPGFLAIAVYRIARELYLLDIPLLPRLISEWAHGETGVDIHPGATIGRNFFIDHGTGTVIGETCVIGNSVKLYQGVTLGAIAVAKSLAGDKRHPTIEDNVVVYANATILGGTTVIGHDSVIGGNAWVTSSIPPFSVVNRQSDVRPRPITNAEEIEFFI